MNIKLFLLLVISPFISFANPQIIKGINAGSKSYFLTTAPNSKLWVSDGTTTGTKEVYSDSFINKPTFNNPTLEAKDLMIGLNEKVIFKASNAQYGEELWISDGTQSGTLLLKDIAPGTANSGIKNFLKLGNKVVFIASAIAGYEELWITDGTSAGTIQLTPTQGWNMFYPENWKVLNNKLYFSKTSNIHPNIWVSDGTVAGTKSLGYYFNPREIQSDGTKTFFTCNSFMGESYIVVTDDTPQGTLSLSVFSDKEPVTGQVLNGKYYFNHPSSIFPHPYSNYFGEMFVSDGTEVGTKPFLDPTITPRYLFFKRPYRHQNHIYFSAQYGWTGDLKKTDGTTITTVQSGMANEWVYEPIRWTNGEPQALSIGNHFYFEGNYYSLGSTELWKSNGEHAGTQRIKTFTGPNISLAISPDNIFNNRFYFIVKDGEIDSEHWVSDGTENGTKNILNINPSLNLNAIDILTISNSEIYFTANKNSVKHLFKTNGLTITQLTGDNCPENINITGATNTNTVSVSSNQVSSISKINTAVKVEYNAGKNVLLSPGFEAKEGSTFLAKIGGCN